MHAPHPGRQLKKALSPPYVAACCIACDNRCSCVSGVSQTLLPGRRCISVLNTFAAVRVLQQPGTCMVSQRNQATPSVMFRKEEAKGRTHHKNSAAGLGSLPVRMPSLRWRMAAAPLLQTQANHTASSGHLHRCMQKQTGTKQRRMGTNRFSRHVSSMVECAH